MIFPAGRNAKKGVTKCRFPSTKYSFALRREGNFPENGVNLYVLEISRDLNACS